MTITTIAFDGDDTLWHHENYFAQAKQQFHDIMNGIGHYPNADELAEAQHISDLPLWGYGVKSFTLSMIGAAIAMTDSTIDGGTVKRILETGRSLYQHPIILLDHVAETIQALQGRYRLMIITKGDLIAQEIKISQSKLAPFFEAIEIVSEKDPDTYKRICVRNHIDPAEFLMVGNSLKSDVLPLLQIGAQAVHIPYEVTWQHELAKIESLHQRNYITLPSIGDLSAALEKLEKLGTGRIADATDPVDQAPRL